MNDRTLAAGAVALIALGALLWWRKRSAPLTATVTTSYGVDLEPIGGPTSYPEPLKEMARAIARQEGFYVRGSIPQRANNPGNLKLGEPTILGTGITVFSSADAGWAALHRQLNLILTGRSNIYNVDMTIAEMAARWTTTEQGPWSRNVAAFLGVPTSTRLWEVLA